MSKLIPFLAAATGLTESDVRTILGRAPISYKHYSIDKRSGGKRLISQPAREVKALQRALAYQLRHLPVHDAATAYRSGQSIRDNAERHVANGPILKFDFSNFFLSIKSTDWAAYCEKNPVFSVAEDIDLSARLLFHRAPGSRGLRLAVGAPSSPWLSNVLLYSFDQAISEAVAPDKVTYTRYADDLTFSARRTGYLTVVERRLRRILREMESPSLSINEGKTVLATTKYRRVVTGLVLSDDGRVTIGRDRKRLVRASVHHALHGRKSGEEILKLLGLIAFANDVEPNFVDALRGYYGVNFIEELMALAAGSGD